MKIKIMLLIFLHGLLYADTEARLLEIPQSIQNCFTTFLVCPLAGESFPDSTGTEEPMEGKKTFSGFEWKLLSGRSPVMISIQKPGMYAAALRLIPASPGIHRFSFGSYAGGCAYINGKKTASFSPHPVYWTNTAEFSADIPAEGVPVTLVFDSRHGRTGFFLKTLNTGIKGQLRIENSPHRKLRAAVSALSYLPDRRFISDGQSLSIRLGGEPGIPVAEAETELKIVFTSPDNKILHTTPVKQFSFPVKVDKGISFSWKPEALRYYRISARAEFYQDGSLINTLSQEFYCPDAMAGRITELRNLLTVSEQKAQHRFPLAGLNLEIAEHLNSLPKRTGGIGERIIGYLDSIPPLMRAAENGVDTQKDNKGYFQRAYFSEADNSYQPYRVYIPRSYSGNASPLFVYLHGYVPSYTKGDWVDEIPELSARMEKTGSLLAVPFGRSNTDFQTIGEGDVLRVISEMKTVYNIDPERIYCIGYSMGGSGMWTITSHYPDMFAAGISIAGRTDYYYWHGLAPGAVVPFKRFLIDNNNPVNMPGNFRNKGFLIFHGNQDTLVKHGHSTRMNRLLQNEGIESAFYPVQGMHWIASGVFTEYNITEWALKHVTEKWPKRISFTSYTPKYKKCYWGEITSFKKYGIPAVFDISRESGSLTVTDSNIRTLTLTVPPALRKNKTLKIIRNGAEKTYPMPENPDFRLSIGDPERASLSKDRLPGPFKEAFNSPFTLVYESGSERSEKNALQFREEWKQFARGTAPCISSSTLTDSQKKSRNLVFFTEHGSDTFLAGLLKQIPVSISSDSFTVGPKSYPGKDRGFAFIYPNPESADHYIAVFSGLPWGRRLPINHKLDHIPDYIIFSDKTEPDGNNTPVAAGFFDMEWNFSKALHFEK